MSKICDHTSVGMLVWQEDKLLLIERGREPFGFAVPAGHVDNDATFEAAAIRELEEEVGLKTEKIELIAEGRKENKCRRLGGDWHYWKFYRLETKDELKPDALETKRIGWYNPEALRGLADRTEKYIRGEIVEHAWAEDPGLEPVMYEWFKALRII